MIIALQTLVFFRESLLTGLERLLSPYYKQLRRTFSPYNLEDEEDEEEVFAEFDDEKGVVFYPPMYAQRYAAVSDCLMDERWCGKLSKVVDLGYHDMSFIRYLKDLPGVDNILGVDLESIPLRCSSDLLDCGDYGSQRDNPLQITLFQGNASDPDYRLIGCDAVVAIEMIEHMLPHDLDRLVHTIFGFIKPWVAIITTPNGDFNELFKSLEENGLRRLDHFFEWSREQFHDWCSNIVSRYPQFTVTCQGIGPGPPGTEHLGCCSQLALFVNNSYVKQQDLNLNSLAMIANFPSPHSIDELATGFESPMTELRSKQNMESSSEFLQNNQSGITLIMSSSPAYSLTTIEYRDKTSQCDLDTEAEKNFLMFNDEDMFYTIMMPRRNTHHRVYEIGDVTSRLNCTTFQARKFSKTTQNIMAKNNIDSLNHRREVVGEICNLTKMLNFNEEQVVQKGDGFTWCNINWGDNAPYWNQYYKVVRGYNYPFQEKSEECRILDLISEEINKQIDRHYSDESTTHKKNLEIPIEYLMKVVRHITNDVDKVKDLLEWNGYIVVGNFVIHSRAILDSASFGSSDVDWPEHDTISELEAFEVQSTPVSDRTTIVADACGRSIRRALDKKLDSLRSMLSVDEDISAELDQVVCQLMKLALRTSKERQEPPPARWMEFKLLDLLTLTENAISRRRKYYDYNHSPKLPGADRNIKTRNKFLKDNRAAKMIVDKYNHLIRDNDTWEIFNDLNFGHEDELGEQYGSYDFLKDYSPKSYVISVNNGQVSLVNENLEPSDQASSKGALKKYVRSPTGSFMSEKHLKKSCKRSYGQISDDKHQPENNTKKRKKSKTSITKKAVFAKILSHTSLKVKGKKLAKDYKTYSTKSKKVKAPKKLHPSPSKPIPGSLVELCHPEDGTLLRSQNFQPSASDRYEEHDSFENQKKTEADIAATEESVLINIVMDDMEETIALRRSIGTDPDFNCVEVEQEQIITNVENEVTNYSLNKPQNSFENVHSQTIFLFDINEPSTSKGFRHISMDVQCGTDTVLPSNGLVTPITSITKLPKLYSTGIRIDSHPNVAVEKKRMDFGTCTNIDTEACGSASKSRSIFSKGIRFCDSRDDFAKRNAMTPVMPNDLIVLPVIHSPVKRTRDSWVNMEENESYNFDMATETHDGTKQYNKLSSELVFTISSCAVSNGINLKDDKCKTDRFDNDEMASITPRTQSVDKLTNPQVGGSLTNLLINNSKTDYQQIFGKVDTPCQFADPTHRTSINESCAPRSTGITIRGSSDDLQTRNNADDSTSTNYNLNKNTSHTETSIVYTSVKMIDIVNEVTIEQDSDVNASPQFSPFTPCKILDSKYIPERPHEFRFKLKNSWQIKNQTRDIDSEEYFKDDIKRQAPNKIVTHIKKDRTSCSCYEHEQQYDFVHTEKIVNASSYTKVNLPRQINDTLDTSVNTFSPTKSFGFKVKDSDENVVKKVEISSTRVELLSDPQKCWTVSQVKTSKTEMSVSSKIKMKDSTSEFYGNNDYSSPKCIRQGTIASANASEEKCLTQSLSKHNEDISYQEGTLLSTVPQIKLTCGGIHIHSFKEKQVSEDIVFQGEWKRNAPKFPRKKYSKDTVIPKKISPIKIRKVFSKQKLKIKTIATKYEVKNEPTKPQRVRNTKNVKAKQDVANINYPIKDIRVRHTKNVKAKQDVADINYPIKEISVPNSAKVIKPNNKSLKLATSKTMSSTITTKNTRNIRSVKKPSNCIKLTQLVKNDCDGVKSEPIKKEHIDYLPPYLKRRLFALRDMKLKNSADSRKFPKLNGKDNTQKGFQKHAYDEIIKTSYTKLQNEPRSDIKYLVFRNDIEKTNPTANTSQSADISNRNETTNKRRSLQKRTSSPLSQTSSTCSTSDSVTTVRPIGNWNKAGKRHSISSNKSSLVNTDSATSPSAIKNRKFSKKCNKLNKKNDGKDHSNKENVPESSKTCYPENQMCLQNIKSAFKSRSKNTFMSKIEDSTLALNDKYQTLTKSNIRIPAIESNEEKIKPENISKKKASQMDDSSSNEEIIRNQESVKSVPSNLVLLVEPLKEHVQGQENKSQEKKTPHTIPEAPVLQVVDSSLLTEWFERGKNSAIDKENTENAILAQMRQLVEEKLDFISNTLNDSSFNDLSLETYRSILPAHDTDLDNTLKSEIENAMNHSLEAVLGNDTSDLNLQHVTATDADLISFKSVTSASRHSQYYMAESDNYKNAHDSQNKITSSVFDIFERKDFTSRVQNTPGTAAAQVFSGFSMDDGRIMGDQPDYINDSEIGVDISRQATSEEMFVSGRSSYETYESCVVEEDVAVPDWLFHVMNPHLVINPDPVAQFDSETGSPSMGYTRLRTLPIDEEDYQQELVPIRMPLVAPVFDANGNVVEPTIGLDAGAGDGRGMHSDYSQDSSGRGSSLSSTDTSSSPQGEATLIDPSAYTTQFEVFHEPVGSSMAVTTLVVPVGSPGSGRQGRRESSMVSTSRNASLRPAPLLLTSDGEADVSSIDTDDIPDSS